MAPANTSVRETARDLLRRAQPTFVAGTAGVTVALLWFALTIASVWEQRYVHMTVGVAWASINVFHGVVVRSVCAQLDRQARADFYARLTPKLVFLLPGLLVVAIGSGLPLALAMKPFPHPDAWVALAGFASVVGISLAFGWRFDAWRDRRWQVAAGVATLVALARVATTLDDFGLTSTGMLQTLFVGTLIIVTGLGFILSGNLRIALELQADDPDPELVGSLGQHNALFARLQAFLLFVIVVSVIRF